MAAGCWLPGCWLPGCWLLAAGCWLPGCWLLAAWLLAAGCLPVAEAGWQGRAPMVTATERLRTIFIFCDINPTWSHSRYQFES
jgi:hypothetical protein